MAYLVKPYTPPYKSLIFNYNSLNNTYNILFDDTNQNWDIYSSGTGILSIECGTTTFLQSEYCVIVTPIRINNNHSINIASDPSINNIINIYCTENQNNTLNFDGLYLATFQINFFNI